MKIKTIVTTTSQLVGVGVDGQPIYGGKRKRAVTEVFCGEIHQDEIEDKELIEKICLK